MTSSNCHGWIFALLLLMTTPTFSYLIVEYNGTTIYMYNIFSTPYANLPTYGTKGYIYYLAECDQVLNDAPPTNTSLLLVQCDQEKYSETLIPKAHALGYIAVLAYSDSSSLKVTDDIKTTNFPFAIIEQKYVSELKALNNTNTEVIIVGSIVSGLLLIGFLFAFVIFSCLCCFCLCCCVCCRCLLRSQQGPDEFEQTRTRQELIESILNRLQQLEGSTQVPLGMDGSKNFPTRLYGENEKLDTCAICVDEFKIGDTVRMLPCQHIFHPKCIDTWLDEYSSLCPLCKNDMREDDNTGLLATQLQNYGTTTYR